MMNYNIVLFETTTNNYLFSVNTGKILKISERLKNELKSHPKNPTALLQHNEKAYPCIFSPSPIQKIEWGYSDTEMQNMINSNLKQMTLGVTNQCNMRCSYCVYSGGFKYLRKHSDHSMSRDTAFKAADYFLKHIADDHEPKFFTFYGGEPLLNYPLLKEIIRYIKAKSKPNANISFSITTNGTLLNRDRINFFIDNKVFLMVSLDGDKETQNKNRKLINDYPSFDLVMNNLKKIREMNKSYYQYFVLFSVTLSEFCDYKKLDDFFSQQGKLSKVSGALTYGNNRLKPTKGTSKNMSYLTHKFIEGCKKNVYDNLNTAGPYLFAMNTVGGIVKLLHKRNVSEGLLNEKAYYFSTHCVPGATKVFVSPNGEFYPCEKLDSFEHLAIGNINNGVNFEKVKTMLMKFIEYKNKHCKSCFLLNICNLCIQTVSDGDNWDEKKLKLFCGYAKNDFKVGLKMYCTILEHDDSALDFFVKPKSIAERR